ncbi:MAG: hypothetical protein ABSG99_02805 [Sedimentisphaerales bacterium]
MEEKQEPKNEFRDQLAKAKQTEKELIEEDAFVVYLWLKHTSELVAADHAHIQSAIDSINIVGNEIFKLPKSKMSESLLRNCKARIENLTKQRDACVMHPKDSVMLAVLEEKFGTKAEKID